MENRISKSKVSLEPLKNEDREQFILDNQRSFKYGSLEEFGVRNEQFEEEGEIIARKTIIKSIEQSKGETYHIVYNGENVGGVVLEIDEANKKGELLLLFVNPEYHSKGIGYAAWCAVEEKHPEIKIWGTLTPHFETRNIHFYVNRCGFHIVEYFSKLHPINGDPNSYMSDSGDFRFEKIITQ